VKVIPWAVLFLCGCTHDASPGIPPVRLRVLTNPPTAVTIVPPRGSGRATVELGHTPVDAATGAFVGDTIRMVNAEQDITYEEVIEYGRAGDLKLISKTFRPSRVRAPRDAGSATDAGP
jgi:hypothetical protein